MGNTKNNTVYDILNLPPRLFKYYSIDSKLIKKRLSGEVYLACPFDFNDPCDCQREVKNNSASRSAIKGDGWLNNKLQELGYTPQESIKIAKSLLLCDDKLKEVHQKQLERVGILCLTQKFSDSLMWGYYANNEGFCIEYDTTKLLKNFVIGFVNSLDYEISRRLYENGRYSLEPSQRTSDLNQGLLEKANEFKVSDLKQVKNSFLNQQLNNDNKLYFIKNIFLKRVYAQSITYNVSPDGSPSLLFFDKYDSLSLSKYFKKTQIWDHENEFRIIASLGGRKIIKLGADCIKNVYLGCNMSNETVVSVIHIMSNLSLKANLYKMIRLKNGGLSHKKIDWKLYKNNFLLIENILNKLK